MKTAVTSTLFIVPTPLGNLSDLTVRALKTLQCVDWIVCEDTRKTYQLLRHYKIEHKPLVCLNTHNEARISAQIVKRLELGSQKSALVCDAGTPLISDPGFSLVRGCREAGITVTALPGPCAAILALSASGLPANRFIFEGFLPARPGERRKYLEEFRSECRTIIFYEAPHRLYACLETMLQVFGPQRHVVLAKELTKIWEALYADCIETLLKRIRDQEIAAKGEFIILLSGFKPKLEIVAIPESIQRLLIALLESAHPPSEAARLVSETTGIPKKRLCQWIHQSAANPEPELNSG